jgi:hypothetical protein
MTNNNTLAQSLTDVVSNFGTAYIATQELLGSNTANIFVMQGQFQMLCQAVGTRQPLQQQPRCPWGGHGRSQQHGGHNGGGNGDGGDGGSGYIIGSGGYNGGGSANQPSIQLDTYMYPSSQSPLPDYYDNVLSTMRS